jgi:alpha-N-acetylglucosaminidase
MLTAGATPIDDLLERIDKGASKKFKIELRQADKDYFELDQQGSRVVIRGNTWVNIGVGLNWYLKYYAGIHLSWNQMQAPLPNVLPRVPQKERHETNLTLRYAFNYCTFSYSMAFWDWERWQREIDWLCLHGVNLPLAIVGEECVWRNMLLRLGYSEDEIGQFIAGPAFLAWWEMNNLEGWGGPLPSSWYTRQEQLQKQILKRMKELGMHPVLPGYCGMMPSFPKASPSAPEGATIDPTLNGKTIEAPSGAVGGALWNGFQRPANLLPTDEHFDEIAQLYYDELTKLYGKADYYSMDPFHESHDDASIDYAESGRKLMAAMKRVNPKAVWVIQGWTENPRPEMVDPMKAGDLLVLDLFSECRPMFGAPSIWKRDEGYKQHQWLFCLLQNFGANVGLHGRMDQLLNNFYGEAPLSSPEGGEAPLSSPEGGEAPLSSPEGDTNAGKPCNKSNEAPSGAVGGACSGAVGGACSGAVGGASGIGFTMEGSENNPVMFELMSELPWRPQKFTKEEWVKNYVKARYAVENDDLQKAWQLLAKTIYNCPAGNNQQGPHESIFCGRPSLNNFQASSWSKMKNYYDPASTLEAARLFLKGCLLSLECRADGLEFATAMPTPDGTAAANSKLYEAPLSSPKGDTNDGKPCNKSNEAPLGAVGGANNLEYDLVDITRQALADQARLQYQHVIADYKAFAIEDFKRSSARFLHMLLLQDSLLATRPEFRLGHWTQAAINCGTTPEEQQLYEWNARVQITTWGNRYCADTGGLRDYAHKEWQGLLRDFYYPRWKAYFDALLAQMEAQTKPQPELLGGGPNANKTASELFALALPQEVTIDWYAMEEPWTKKQNSYSAQPEGNALQMSIRVMQFLSNREQ